MPVTFTDDLGRRAELALAGLLLCYEEFAPHWSTSDWGYEEPGTHACERDPERIGLMLAADHSEGCAVGNWVDGCDRCRAEEALFKARWLIARGVLVTVPC